MSRNQKVLAAVVAVLVVVACLAAVWVFVLHGGDAIRWRSDFHIDRLEELSELVTLRVQVSDVLCAEAKGVRAAFLVAGDAVISVDMGLAQVANRDDAARTATLLLPAPAVLNARVDHRRTLTYDVRRRLFASSRAESRVRDAAMATSLRCGGSGSMTAVSCFDYRRLLLRAFVSGWSQSSPIAAASRRRR